MPKVKFLGTSDQSKYGEVGAVQVDDVELVAGAEPQEVSDDQLERLNALEGHRFQVEQKNKS